MTTKTTRWPLLFLVFLLCVAGCGDPEAMPVDETTAALGAPAFASPRGFLTGRGSPSGVAAGDFDGDGRLDLATVAQTDDAGTVWFGQGGGRFVMGPDFAAGAAPYHALSGDFDGDGKPDLAVVSDTGSAVTILLGKGDGTFRHAARYGVGKTPRCLASGDFNHDGRPDLVTANADGASVSVLLNHGDGTFRGPVSYESGNTTASVAVADLNGDGRLDLAIPQDNRVAILFGKGDGTFQKVVQAPFFGLHGREIAAGDLNGDGRPDLAVASSFRSSHSLEVLLNQGGGTFAAPVSYAATGDGAQVLLVDLNRDGKLDVAVLTADSSHSVVDVVASCSSEGKLAVLPGKGDGTFGAAVLYAVASAGRTLLVDFNRDGKLDVATANPFGFGPTGIDVLAGKGGGVLGAPLHLDLVDNGSAAGLAAADFNGDGKPDLAAAETPNGRNLAAVLLNQTR